MDHLWAALGPLLALEMLYVLLVRGLWHGTAAQATAGEMTALRWFFAAALVPDL